MSKLFILGWDNALIEDVTEKKLHPSYLRMLEELSPVLSEKWTIEDTRRMQGICPEKIWRDFSLAFGNAATENARRIFYETYANTPKPGLVSNAYNFLRKLYAYGYVVAVVSNKSQDILLREMSDMDVLPLVTAAIGTGKNSKVTTADGDQAKIFARYELLKMALDVVPCDGGDVVVVAHSGYAEPAYAISAISRFEEASPQVFDWLCDELKPQTNRVFRGRDGGDWL